MKLEDTVMEAGLEKIFRELRISHANITKPIYEWGNTLTNWIGRDAFTYKYLFGTIVPRAMKYLKKHLDDLFNIFLF